MLAKDLILLNKKPTNKSFEYNLDGQTARNYLTGTKSWNIVDGGFES